MAEATRLLTSHPHTIEPKAESSFAMAETGAVSPCPQSRPQPCRQANVLMLCWRLLIKPRFPLSSIIDSGGNWPTLLTSPQQEPGSATTCPLLKDGRDQCVPASSLPTSIGIALLVIPRGSHPRLLSSRDPALSKPMMPPSAIRDASFRLLSGGLQNVARVAALLNNCS